MIEIAKIAPSLGILIYFIMYFKAELKNKNEEIAKLNAELRENDKQSLIAMSKMTDAIESLTEIIKDKLK